MGSAVIVNQHEDEQEYVDVDFPWSLSKIGNALDWLDSKDDDDVIDGTFMLNSRRPNAHGGLHSRHNRSTLQPLSKTNHKFLNRIRDTPLEEWEGRRNIPMSNLVTTEIRASLREMSIGKTKTCEKADRATVEQAIDPRTRMILFKMMNKGVFDNINGCISTGKEANVYHATKLDGQELAIKIHKTSVMVFKDREKYVQGDFRFGHRYKKTRREMVEIWVDKERNNLCRIRAAGIRCPAIYDLRRHILVMEFIGKAGWAAPRLKDAGLSMDKLREGYAEIIIAMRTLYQKSGLVHGDLSEYNILHFEGHLYIIDVSQAVDLNHPLRFNFLWNDCVNISAFFKKNGVAVMTVQELFHFIVDSSIADDAVDSYLEEVQRKISARRDVSAEDEIADSLFVELFTPMTISDDMYSAERITNGKDAGDLYYQIVAELRQGLSRPQPSQPQNENTQSTHMEEVPVDDEDDESQSDADENSSWEGSSFSENEKVSPLDRKAARKEHKKKVKEEKREARKHKVPKTLKKRRKKMAKGVKMR